MGRGGMTRITDMIISFIGCSRRTQPKSTWSDSSLMPVELSIVLTPTFNRIFVLSAAKYEMPDS
jgi:hypothetical protein